LMYAFGAFICHQRPERSFYTAAAQLPVCARCLGLYVGAAVAALLLIVASRSTRKTPVRTMLIVAALPTAMTWVAEASGLVSPSNLTRFIGALPLGAAVAVTVNYVQCARPQRNESRLPPTRI
jgi:uncharacterized membrane protein